MILNLSSSTFSSHPPILPLVSLLTTYVAGDAMMLFKISFLAILLTTLVNAQTPTSSSSTLPLSVTSATPTPSTTTTATQEYNTTLTDASPIITYGSGGICNAASCSVGNNINPWIATWGQDNLTTEYFTFHATNQALARESGGIPYLTFNFNGSAIYLYVITSLSSRGVFNISTDGGGTYTSIYQTVTTPVLLSNQLVWSETGLDPTTQHTLILRFWADAGGPTALNGVDANGASLNIQSFVVTQPGPNPNSISSSSSSSSTSSSSTSPAASGSSTPGPNYTDTIYGASDRQSLILGLSIGLPLFFIFLVLFTFLVLCGRRRRRRQRSDDEKSSSSWFTGANTSRGNVPTRYRGGRSESEGIVAPAGAAATGAVAGATAAAASRRAGTGNLRNLDARDISSDALYSTYPGYSARDREDPVQTTPPKRPVGPLLVPRETILPPAGPAEENAGHGSSVPFVLGLGGETNRDAGQRRKDDVVGGGIQPQSGESRAGGTSGDQGGEESEADTTPSNDGDADESDLTRNIVPSAAAVVRQRRSGDPNKQGSDVHALIADDGRGMGSGPARTRKSSATPSVASRIGDLPKSSDSLAYKPTKPSRLGPSGLSSPPHLDSFSASSSTGGGGFVNAIDVPIPSRTAARAPQTQDNTTRAESPKPDTHPTSSHSPPTQHGAEQRTIDLSSENDLFDSNKATSGGDHGSMPSPGLFYDTFIRGAEGRKTPHMGGHDSPIASTPEPLPKSPLEYFNESQAQIHAVAGPDSSGTQTQSRPGPGPLGRKRSASGGGNSGKATVGLGLGLVSPAPTVDD